MNNLVGQTYTFDDNDSITVVQVRLRDNGESWVTYHVQQGPGIPRKLVCTLEEFMNMYGHLFEK